MREPEPRRLDAAPPSGQVPEQEHEANLEPRLTGDGPDHVEVVGAALGAAKERVEDLGPGADALHKLGIKKSEAAGMKRPPYGLSLDQLVLMPARWLEQVTRSQELGDGSIGHACVNGQQTVDNEQSGPLSHAGKPG